MENMTILIGTIGQGIARSSDGGETWQRLPIEKGMHVEGMVRALVSHPRNPEVLFAGTDKGIYRSNDAGETWQLLGSPLSDYSIWTLAVDPVEPEVMFAGTGTPTPPKLFRSTDAGKSWEPRPMEVVKECAYMGVPRVTRIAIDPANRRQIWAGIEIDGVRRSTDGGDTWAATSPPIPDIDVHNLAMTEGPPKTLFVVAENEVFTSTDDGASWNPVYVREIFPWGYSRGIAVQSGDPRVVFITIGDTTPGRTGGVMRSKDAGRTWESLPLPVQPNSAMWVVTTHPADPNIVFAASRYGQLFRSNDGGDSWNKLWREFSEVASILVVPN